MEVPQRVNQIARGSFLKGTLQSQRQSHGSAQETLRVFGVFEETTLFGEEPGKNCIFLILRTFAPGCGVESADKYFERKREETKKMVYSKPRKPWVFLEKKSKIKNQIGSSAKSESNWRGSFLLETPKPLGFPGKKGFAIATAASDRRPLASTSVLFRPLEIAQEGPQLELKTALVEALGGLLDSDNAPAEIAERVLELVRELLW